jgi:hypothetical protein
MFLLSNIEELAVKGTHNVYCGDQVAVNLGIIAPDVTLADVDTIDYKSITLEAEIGSGGYPLYYIVCCH